MRIVQLHAENFKRLGVVEINPDGHVVTIGGKNGHGKSSVLDAIYVALKGRAVAPPQPVRKGEEKCTIRLDLGEMIVTRTFIQKDGLDFTDTIKVESADGLRYQKPQQVLSGLLGEVGFDPFEFVNLKPKEQAKRLLEMVPLSIDLDEFAELDASDFAKRRDFNREVARLKAQVDAIEVEALPEDLPDRDALTDALGNAANTNAEINADRDRRQQRAQDATHARVDADDLDEQARGNRAEAARLIKVAEDQETRASQKREVADQIDAEVEALAPLAEHVDTDVIRQQIRDADAAQAIVDRQARRKMLADQLAAEQAEADKLSRALETRAAQRNAALAEADMPVPGLSFSIGEDGEATLMFDGLPFDKDQISTAAQLRVSTAIGMAANPRLRVLRIMDGSLLDEDSMKMLAEMAEAEDFQLWVEVVGDGGVGIIMENGLVRGAAEAEGEHELETDQEPEAQADETEETAPAGRQYFSAKFGKAATLYTYHNDGPPVWAGQRVLVPTGKDGQGQRAVVVHAIGLPKPDFTTKAVIGPAPEPSAADEGKLL